MVTGDVANEEIIFLWDELILPLYGASGKFITFAVSYKEAVKRPISHYLDDVIIEKETLCGSILNVFLENL